MTLPLSTSATLERPAGLTEFERAFTTSGQHGERLLSSTVAQCVRETTASFGGRRFRDLNNQLRADFVRHVKWLLELRHGAGLEREHRRFNAQERWTDIAAGRRAPMHSSEFALD